MSSLSAIASTLIAPVSAGPVPMCAGGILVIATTSIITTGTGTTGTGRAFVRE